MKNTMECKCKKKKKIQRDLTVGIFQSVRKVKFPKRTASLNEKMDNQTNNLSVFLVAYFFSSIGSRKESRLFLFFSLVFVFLS